MSAITSLISDDEFTENLMKILEQVIQYGVDHVWMAEKLLLSVWESLYSPKQVFHNLMLIAAIQTSVVFFQTLSAITNNFTQDWTEKGRRERALLKELSEAKTYSDWQKVAAKLDELKGYDVWRKVEQSAFYDSATISKRISGVVDMLDKGDMFNLMFRLRGGLSRDQFGIMHSGLFTRAMAGTKKIIERYHETIASALNFICDMPDPEVPNDAKLAFFNETRHSYGRTALLLSGGGYLGYYHMGVVRALYTQRMLPRVISGSSAGSIMTAVVGTRTDDELDALVGTSVPDDISFDFLNHSQELRHPTAIAWQKLVPEKWRFWSSLLLSFWYDGKVFNLDTERFKRALIQDIGLLTFQEAFDRTGRIINITVAPLNAFDPPRLLNYITAPHVCVWSAAAASSAIPGMFDPVALMVREPDGQYRAENEWTRQGLVGADADKAARMAQYSDGSVEQDLPMQQLSELFNVNHFIVSQVNPHSALLTSMALQATVWSNPFYRALIGYARFLKDQCRDWLKNLMNLFIFRSTVGNARKGIIQTLTQDYEGRATDVTIMPWTGHISPYTAILSTIKNPTEEEYLELLGVAEANTWPFMSRIRAHCLVEKTLDKCVMRLREKIASDAEREYQAHLQRYPNSPSRTKDRTPSFYVSRSMANLTGLSVADPAPMHNVAPLDEEQRQQQAVPKVGDLRDNLTAGRNSNRNSLSEAWNLGASSVDQQQYEDSPVDIDEETDFWNVSVPTVGMPLSEQKKPRGSAAHVTSQQQQQAIRSNRASFAVQSTDDLLKILGASTDNLMGTEGKPMKRRPSMANFYYKHGAGSTENLN